MGFAGPNGALGAPCVSAACPYELLEQLPAAALEAAPPLRVLLVSGVADVDVPASMSLKLAAKAWAAPRSPHPPHPLLHLLLVPGADHYLVAGLADTSADAAAAEQWASVCAALRAFVDEDDGRLAPLCGGWFEVASWARHSSAAPPGLLGRNGDAWYSVAPRYALVRRARAAQIVTWGRSPTVSACPKREASHVPHSGAAPRRRRPRRCVRARRRTPAHSARSTRSQAQPATLATPH